MKRLLLLVIAGMLLATPALANKSAATSPTLLIKSPKTISITTPNCVGFRINNTATAACTQEYYSWIVQRNATITEIQIQVVDPAAGMAGHCQLELYVEEGSDAWTTRLNDTDYYVDVTAGSTAGSSARYNVDIDVTRGQFIGFYFNNVATILGSTCQNNGSDDPQVVLRVYGEYTD
jgi:hypothetical protein